jgi:hypothetical protein
MRTQPAAVSIRGFDPADEPVAAENRQHVPPPTPLGRRHEELPHLVETEQGPEEASVPDQRIEGGTMRRSAAARAARVQQLDLLAEDEALAAPRTASAARASSSSAP